MTLFARGRFATLFVVMSAVPSPPASPPLPSRYWTEGPSSDFKDALKGVPYSKEKGRLLATFLVQDYINALHGLRFIRVAGDNVTDPAFPCIFFDGWFELNDFVNLAFENFKIFFNWNFQSQ